jgi:hypothetical protein
MQEEAFMVVAARTRRFDTHDYHALAAAKILSETDRVELIEGEIVEMTPIGSRHAGTVNRLNRFFSIQLGESAPGLLTISYTIASRSPELGIRLALGASPNRLAGLLLRFGLGLCAIGLGSGLVLASWGRRFLEPALFQVDAGDPAVLSLSALVLIGAALAASWLPGRRIRRIDPAAALRKG